jgi:ABC-type glycerol-3-phosphate transport system permease component
MTTIIIGMAIAILLIIAGAATIFKRRQMSIETQAFEGSKLKVDVRPKTKEGSVGIGASANYFCGKQQKAKLYTEIGTAEILDMVRQGRWNEAWPWVALSIGVTALFVLLPLFIGTLAGWPDSTLCLVAALIVVGVLFAAWPRRNQTS